MLSLNFETSIVTVGELAGAFLTMWGALKLLVASKTYIKKIYRWILNKFLQSYVESVTQEKLNERLANIAD